jgi:NADPH-dependent curcumin reductase CurA
VPGYQEPVPLGEVMIGFTLGEVTASNHPDYNAGDIVYGRQGWQEWAVSDGGNIERKVDPADGPLSAAMHVLGMTGLTAYLGLLEVGQPKAGDTVVVSTAAGAVGSTVGQIAKIKGCRTVGITGSGEKLRSCLEEFGYDAALDYKTESDLSGALGAACPGGVDVYFDNTGGEISDAVLQHINVGARIVVCGIIGIKGGLAATGPRPNRQLLMKRARMEGFLVLDHMDRLSEALGDLSAWVRQGRSSTARTSWTAWRTRPPRCCVCSPGETRARCCCGSARSRPEALPRTRRFPSAPPPPSVPTPTFRT